MVYANFTQLSAKCIYISYSLHALIISSCDWAENHIFLIAAIYLWLKPAKCNVPLAEMESHWLIYIYISRAHLSFTEAEGMENILCVWDVALSG